jgi:hypothetical protein
MGADTGPFFETQPSPLRESTWIRSRSFVSLREMLGVHQRLREWAAMSTSPPRRPFNLMDAMVLIAATAAGLGTARGIRDLVWEATGQSVMVGSIGPTLLLAARSTVLAYPFLVAWTIALSLLLFLPRRFRPSLGDLINRPGTAACGAAAMAITIGTVNLAVLIVVAFARNGTPLNSKEFLGSCVYGIIHNLGVELGMPGLGVTVAWSMLALSGRWRSEPNWLDRTGRSLGLAWVVLMVFHPWLTSIFEGIWS